MRLDVVTVAIAKSFISLLFAATAGVGQLAVFLESNQNVLAFLQDGDYFGEGALLTEEVCTFEPDPTLVLLSINSLLCANL